MRKRRLKFNYTDARKFRSLFREDPFFQEVVKAYMKVTNAHKQESAETIIAYETLQMLTILDEKELERFLHNFGEALNISLDS